MTVPPPLPSALPSTLPSTLPSALPSGLPSALPASMPTGLPNLLPDGLPPAGVPVGPSTFAVAGPERSGDAGDGAPAQLAGIEQAVGFGGADASPPADVAPLRLLVVDDDAVDRMAVRRALQRARLVAEVDEAGSAAEALARLTERAHGDGAHACVLLDFHLPDGDGLAVLRAMRRDGLRAPVVMLTGHGDEQVAVELMKAGAVDYLPKGALSPERLAASVRHAVELARAVDAARAAEAELRASAERARFLAEAGAVLADARDMRRTMERLARLAVPMLGDYCLVYLPHADGGLEAVASAHRDPALASVARTLEASFRPHPSDPSSALAAAMRTGQAVHVPTIDRAYLHRVTEGNPAAREALERLMPTTAVVVPLCTRGQLLGAVAFARTTPGAAYEAAERALGEELAARAAVALDNARLYEAAERARAEAVEANRTKSEFLARMSHDLRTPLNAIGGYAQLVELEVHGPVTPAQREAMGRIGRAQQHLLALINDILSFARLEAGQVQLVLAAVPLAPLLGEVAELIEPQAEAAGVHFRLASGDGDAGAPAPVVRADRERLTQILLNLLGNAVKFTPPGGTVTLGWRAAGPGEVAVEVRDTGRGIAAARLQAIFDPFVQEEREPEGQRRGVGLGLAISRELARGMGASIGVASEVGCGSTFTVTLLRGEGG